MAAMHHTSSALGAVLAAAGGIQVAVGAATGDVPAAQVMAPVSGPTVTVPVWLISLAIGAGLSLVGFLLKRALDQLDSKLAKLDAKLEDAASHRTNVEARLAVVETKVDALHEGKKR